MMFILVYIKTLNHKGEEWRWCGENDKAHYRGPRPMGGMEEEREAGWKKEERGGE